MTSSPPPSSTIKPTKRPAEGFEWKGKGTPESGEGAWTRGKNQDKESLHPDFNHPGDVAPHWDYQNNQGKARLFLDGEWDWK